MGTLYPWISSDQMILEIVSLEPHNEHTRTSMEITLSIKLNVRQFYPRETFLIIENNIILYSNINEYHRSLSNITYPSSRNEKLPWSSVSEINTEPHWLQKLTNDKAASVSKLKPNLNIHLRWTIRVRIAATNPRDESTNEIARQSAGAFPEHNATLQDLPAGGMIRNLKFPPEAIRVCKCTRGSQIAARCRVFFPARQTATLEPIALCNALRAREERRK